MTKDMTIGNPAKIIIYFSIPILIGNVFQQLYNMADTAIVGRYINVEALSAVGSTGSLSFLIFGFIFGLTSGFSIVVAQRFGANDYDGVRKSVATSIVLCIGATVIITALALMIANPLLRLMRTPENILADASTYITIIFMGSVGVIFYNMVSSILRAVGDSKTPLYFLIMASVINIVLDLVFIINFKWGVAGAAAATIISQIFSAIVSFLYATTRYEVLKLKKSDWQIDKSNITRHLKLGLPMAFQFSFIAVGALILQAALNSFGHTTIASFTAASKVEQLVTTPLNTFGATMATFAGQNLGAGKLDRIKAGVRSCSIISLAVSVLSSVFVILFGSSLIRLFVGGEEPAIVNEVVSNGRHYLNILAIFFPILAMLFIYRNALQGMGNTFAPMFACVAELIMRSAAAFTLPAVIGFTGICLAGPLAWVGAAIPLAIWYYYTIRKMTSSPERV